MSYNFDYDPSTNKTPWPLVWTVTPEKYNFEGTVGQDNMNFTVEAIPDPNYPDAWNDYHTPDNPPSGPTGGTTVPDPPPLPPEPVLQRYIVKGDEESDPQILSSQYYTIDSTYGLNIDDVDIRIMFPYQSIKYNKDGEIKTAKVPQEVIDDDFDFIVEFLPDERESIEKKLTIEAMSNSTDSLEGTFWFLLNNDWTEATNLLKDLAEISKENIENRDSSEPDEIKSTNENGSQTIPFDPGSVQEEQYVSFEEKTGMTYDELFREKNPNKINTVIEETGKEQFLENIKRESENNSNDGLSNPLLNEGSTVDEIFKNNTVQSLVEKYNLTSEEVLNYLRNI